MNKWAYAGFVPHFSIPKGRFIYYELETFRAKDVVPPPTMTVSVPHNGTVELRAYWGNVQEKIAKDYGVSQQTVSRWIDEFKLSSAIADRGNKL